MSLLRTVLRLSERDDTCIAWKSALDMINMTAVSMVTASDSTEKSPLPGVRRQCASILARTVFKVLRLSALDMSSTTSEWSGSSPRASCSRLARCPT
eukprot:3043715-Rhodomonas_salina.1